jgi:hypothetical protein
MHIIYDLTPAKNDYAVIRNLFSIYQGWLFSMMYMGLRSKKI